MKVKQILFILLICFLTILTSCNPVQPSLIFTPSATMLQTPSPTFQPRSTATAKPRPTRSVPNFFYTPTPVFTWKTKVISATWDRFIGFDWPIWLNNSTVSVYDSEVEGIRQFHIINLTDQNPAEIQIISDDSDWVVGSPDKSYVIECTNTMKMVQVEDQKIISEIPSPYNPGEWPSCSESLIWSPDGTYVTYIDPNKNGYIWFTGEQESRFVMDHMEDLQPSPDSQKIAVGKYDPETRSKIVSIINLDGMVLSQFNANVMDSTGLIWLTNDVLFNFTRYVRSYYKASTGEWLFDWVSMPTGNAIWHQQPSASPNARWIFIDQGDVLHLKVSIENQLFVEKDYSLYDVKQMKRIPVLHSIGNYLDNAGWDMDGSKLYLVSRPAESVSISAEQTPFGLLTYDPNTQTFESVFKNAVKVIWNSDRSLAFVIFAHLISPEQWGLMGTIWNPVNGERKGNWYLDDEMIYSDPSMDRFHLIFPDPARINWSHDGQKVAVADGFGKITLLDIEGTSSDIIEDPSFANGWINLLWSPDDNHLLIEKTGQAWIVDVSPYFK